jgi:hypothetical protein
MDTQTVGQLVRELETQFTSGGGTQMSKYVRTDLYEDINTIYAYLESKHISGEFDSLGREKPFFNIVLASRNIWFRATDIDRKNIILKATSEGLTLPVFFLYLYLQDWMRKENFGQFLNNWGLALAGFNSSVVKFVEKDGRLICQIVPWSKLIVDQINFEDNLKIEILELTESQLYEKFGKEAFDNLVGAKKARETTNKQKKDNKNNYYKLYEVHGKLPLSNLTGKETDTEPVQQMHVISMVGKKNDVGEDVYTLYKGREEKDPYMLTWLIPSEDGSISLNGSVKNLFQAQWMVNHTKKAIKDQLDLASKLIFQTADGNFVGQNAIASIETGDILIHEVNKPLTQIANNSHDVTALQSFGQEWKALGSELNGISEAMLGVAPKSGTAWRQTEALLQESYSLFEIMTENKGLHLEQMLKRYILPFLKKKMNNDKEIMATLDMQGVKEISERYIKAEAIRRYNKQIIKDTLNGNIPQAQDLEQLQSSVKDEMNMQGNQRFFKPSEITWKKEFDAINLDEIEIEITGESSDTQAILTTIDKALTIIANPNYQNNKQAQYLVNKALTKTGFLSPVELSSMPEPTPIAPPQGGQVEAIPQLSNNIQK